MNSTKTQTQIPAFKISNTDVEALIYQTELLRAQAIAEGIRAFFSSIKKGVCYLHRLVVEPIAKAQKKSNLYHELSNLNDRTLADLGISRSNIPHFVMNAFEDTTTEINETASMSDLQAPAAAPIMTASNDGDQAIAA